MLQNFFDFFFFRRYAFNNSCIVENAGWANVVCACSVACHVSVAYRCYCAEFDRNFNANVLAYRKHTLTVFNAVACVLTRGYYRLGAAFCVCYAGFGKHVQDFILEGSMADVDAEEMTKRERLCYAKDQMLATLKKVWVYILIGVGIGATIHNFIPTEWVQAVLGEDKWYSVLIASGVGVPMYADIFGTIPVAEALFFKGVGVGTILSFMMSVTALSLPSMIMLSKAVKPKLLFSFIAIVVAGIIIIGYVFNAVGFLFI